MPEIHLAYIVVHVGRRLFGYMIIGEKIINGPDITPVPFPAGWRYDQRAGDLGIKSIIPVNHIIGGIIHTKNTCSITIGCPARQRCIKLVGV
jgi:hypothetical protein